MGKNWVVGYTLTFFAQSTGATEMLRLSSFFEVQVLT